MIFLLCLLHFILSGAVLANDASLCGSTGTGGKMSSASAAATLNYHNAMRRNVSLGTYQAKGTTLGPAVSMPPMQWNCTVAAAAQRWADRCVFEHEKSIYGENLFMGMSSTTAALNKFYPIETIGLTASRSWQNEFQDNVITTLVTGQYSAMLGHATQMIWSTSTQLGCGYATNCRYSNNFFMTLVVCRYYLPGNYLGQQPFTPQCNGSAVAANNLACVGGGGRGGAAASPARGAATPPARAAAASPARGAAGSSARRAAASPARRAAALPAPPPSVTGALSPPAVVKSTRPSSSVLPSTQASGCSGSAFSQAGATAILDAHNTIRTQVRLGNFQANGTRLGPAAGLGNLTWDCSLASAAQQWANTCPLSGSTDSADLVFHGAAPVNPPGFPDYFDQAYPTDDSGIQAFTSFVSPLQSNVVSTLVVGQPQTSPFLSATQILWSSTSRVGCATAVCNSNISDANGVWASRLVVCRYAPSGNARGEQPFQPTCSSSSSVSANRLTCT